MEYFVQESQWIVRERLAIDELTLKIELDQAALNQAYLQLTRNKTVPAFKRQELFRKQEKINVAKNMRDYRNADLLHIMAERDYSNSQLQELIRREEMFEYQWFSYVMGPTYVPGPPPQYYLHQRQMIIQDTMVWNERLRDLVVKIRSKFNFN